MTRFCVSPQGIVPEEESGYELVRSTPAACCSSIPAAVRHHQQPNRILIMRLTLLHARQCHRVLRRLSAPIRHPHLPICWAAVCEFERPTASQYSQYTAFRCRTGVNVGSIAKGRRSRSLGGLLGRSEVSPHEAAAIPQQDVEELARTAEKHDPSVIDRVSELYSEHPGLVKTLGAAAWRSPCPA